jgi:hypothetical protein
MPLFRKAQDKTADQSKPSFEGGGLVLFETVQDAMRAERLLQHANYTLKLVAPPPQLRKGCDLALEINLVEQLGIERLLKQEDVSYVEIAPLQDKGATELLRLTKITDFGRWIMVKAGNMKISYEKESGTVVNVSGGGCPDIPFLHAELIDKPLDGAPSPKELGYTLCARMLDVALDEAKSLWTGGKKS